MEEVKRCLVQYTDSDLARVSEASHGEEDEA